MRYLFLFMFLLLVTGGYASQITIKDTQNRWEIIFGTEERWSEWVRTGKQLPPMTAETNFTCYVEDCVRAPTTDVPTVIPLNQSASELISQQCNATGCIFSINIPYVEASALGGGLNASTEELMLEIPASLFDELVNENVKKLETTTLDLDVCERNRETCETGYREYRTDTTGLMEQRDGALDNCLGTLNMISINSSQKISEAYERGEATGWRSSQTLNKYTTYGAIALVCLIAVGLVIRYYRSKRMWL